MAKKHEKRRGSSGSPVPKPGQTKKMGTEIDLSELIQKIDLGAAKSFIQAIEEKRGETKLLCFVYNDLPPVPTILAPPALMPLEKVLYLMGKVPNLDLFLRCTGGITEVAWRVVSLLREFTDRLGVIVSRIAFSGATHIAIAADELVMTAISVLSSVDPTRRHPLLPKDSNGNPIPTSVEDLKHCIKFIRDQLGDSYPEQDLALIISELFKYIDPLAIGALEQSYNLSKLITKKCLETRNTPLSEEKIKNIVEQLAGKYYSHSFQISRSEVETDLGLPVTRPDPDLSELIEDLGDSYLKHFNTIVEIEAGNSKAFFRVGGVIQTAEGGWAIGQVFTQEGKVLGDSWLEFN